MPAKSRKRQTTDRRPHRRADRQHDADEVHDAGGFRAGELIAHHGACNGHANGSADALNEAREQQHFDGWGQKGEHTTAQKDRQEDEARLAPPEGVGCRPGKQLGDGKTGKIEREAEFYGGLGGCENACQFRHGRRVNRHGNGRQRCQQCSEQSRALSGHDRFRHCDQPFWPCCSGCRLLRSVCRKLRKSATSSSFSPCVA